MCRRWLLGAMLVVAALGSRAAYGGDTFGDPFAYCKAVGTIDAPDARYTGPEVPADVASGLQKAFAVAALPPPLDPSLRSGFDVAPSEPLAPFERGTFWRCMDGAVYACNVGANLPCEAKPAADPQPTDGMRDWCRDNAGSDFIPMYVTGHDTIYDWSCDGTTPKRGKRTSELDARGYVASIWHRLTPPR